MFSRFATVALFSVLALTTAALRPQARAAHGNISRRTLAGQTTAFTCFGGGGNCECPDDNNGDQGVLINVFPGYQCAYAGGACTWDDKTGELQNPGQTNCPTTSPCSTDAGCVCPIDNDGNTGVMIHQFTGYQCAYPSGACTWNGDGALQNVGQTNCVTQAKCKQSGVDA